MTFTLSRLSPARLGRGGPGLARAGRSLRQAVPTLSAGVFAGQVAPGWLLRPAVPLPRPSVKHTLPRGDFKARVSVFRHLGKFCTA